jgi:hypothetical protein
VVSDLHERLTVHFHRHKRIKPAILSRLYSAMKVTIGLVMLCGSCFAQTYVTNYVTAAPHFRRVDGKLYNTQKSVLWLDIKAECLNVTTNGVLLQKFTVNRVYKTDPVSYGQSIGAYSSQPPTRHLISETKIPGQKLILRNYPTNNGAASGQVIEATAMRVGSIDYKGETLELWDYGTPNVVPVVTKAQ